MAWSGLGTVGADIMISVLHMMYVLLREDALVVLSAAFVSHTFPKIQCSVIIHVISVGDCTLRKSPSMCCLLLRGHTQATFHIHRSGTALFVVRRLYDNALLVHPCLLHPRNVTLRPVSLRKL